MRWFLAFSLILGACGAKAVYTRYTLQLPDYSEGTLLAVKEAEDRPVSDCEPDDLSSSKCVVLKEEEWDRLQRDLIDLEARLEACEKTCGN